MKTSHSLRTAKPAARTRLGEPCDATSQAARKRAHPLAGSTYLQVPVDWGEAAVGNEGCWSVVRAYTNHSSCSFSGDTQIFQTANHFELEDGVGQRGE